MWGNRLGLSSVPFLTGGNVTVPGLQAIAEVFGKDEVGSIAAVLHRFTVDEVGKLFSEVSFHGGQACSAAWRMSLAREMDI